MNIPDEVIEQAARIAWADEPGATIAEFDQLNPVGRAELMDTARKSAQVVAEWARKEALWDAARKIFADSQLGYVTINDSGIMQNIAYNLAMAAGHKPEEL